MPGKYVNNNELTAEALLTSDLIKKSTFSVGPPVPVIIKESEDNKSAVQKRQYYQKFVEITYPDGDKSASMLIPNCVMHHDVQNYYGKPSIYVGIPQSWVREMSLKLSRSDSSPIFADKKILSDQKYWWTRASLNDAEENKEFIRTVDDEGGIDYYGGFAEVFADFPTAMIANITGSLKLKTDTALNETLTGKEEWRCGLSFSMFTPYDATEVTAPSTGINQKSGTGAADKMKSGLAKFRKNQQ